MMWHGFKEGEWLIDCENTYYEDCLYYVADTWEDFLEALEADNRKYWEKEGRESFYASYIPVIRIWGDQVTTTGTAPGGLRRLSEVWPDPCPKCEQGPPQMGDYLCPKCRYG
jgi:hypothetical protein